MSLMSRHALALLAAGQPLPLAGRLLLDEVQGREVAVDAATGNEVSPVEGTWVLSDEGEASDGNLVMQEWDLTRANRAGIHVLWHHTRDPLVGAAALGRWMDLTVRTGVPDTVGRCLTGKIEWAETVPAGAAHIRAQVEQKMLRGVSIGWIPGAMTPRGQLDPADPRYREPVDEGCGPEEGFVMGSPEEPNELVETSLTSVIAQPRAYARARLGEGASRAVEALRAGHDPRGGDLERLLALVADHPRVQRFLAAREERLIARIRAELGMPAPSTNTLPWQRKG